MNKGCFKKGNIPFNKGVKMSPELYEKCKATMFKKGNVSVNYYPVNTIHIWIDKNKTPRKYIKIADTKRWILYAVFLYKIAYGKIPKELILHHKDFDSLNDTLENLKLVTRTEHINIHRNQLLAGRGKTKISKMHPVLF
jgi:hypothetical protein